MNFDCSSMLKTVLRNKQYMIMLDDSWIYGIAFGCPYTERTSNCPLIESDHLSYKRKVYWVLELSQNDRRSILIHHQACSEIRARKYKLGF